LKIVGVLRMIERVIRVREVNENGERYVSELKVCNFLELLNEYRGMRGKVFEESGNLWVDVMDCGENEGEDVDMILRRELERVGCVGIVISEEIIEYVWRLGW